MKCRVSLLGAVLTCSLLSQPALATGWCEIDAGFSVVTHGGKSETVWIFGRLAAQAGPIWIEINDSSGSGKYNVAVALSADVAQKGLSVFLDKDTYTCATFPSWSEPSELRHLKIVH